MIKSGYKAMLEDFVSTFCIMFCGVSIVALELCGVRVLYAHNHNLWGLVATIFSLSFNLAALHIYWSWWD